MQALQALQTARLGDAGAQRRRGTGLAAGRHFKSIERNVFGWHGVTCSSSVRVLSAAQVHHTLEQSARSNQRSALLRAGLVTVR